jgi:hypothetical protein
VGKKSIHGNELHAPRALARRLAVITHHIVHGTELRWTERQPQQHDNRDRSNVIGGSSNSTKRWQ